MKILVADDDLVSRKLVANMLDASGYEVLLVADGEHALRLLQAAGVQKYMAGASFPKPARAVE